MVTAKCFPNRVWELEETFSSGFIFFFHGQDRQENATANLKWLDERQEEDSVQAFL